MVECDVADVGSRDWVEVAVAPLLVGEVSFEISPAADAAEDDVIQATKRVRNRVASVHRRVIRLCRPWRILSSVYWEWDLEGDGGAAEVDGAFLTSGRARQSEKRRF